MKVQLVKTAKNGIKQSKSIKSNDLTTKGMNQFNLVSYLNKLFIVNTGNERLQSRQINETHKSK